MTHYAIRNNDEEFQYLDLTVMDILRNAPEDIPMDDILDFHRHNTAMAGWWKTPETGFKANDAFPTDSIPDVSVWPIASLVLSPKATRLLRDTLEPFGELLPVIVGDDTFHLFNCLTLGEEDTTEFNYEDGMKMEMTSVTFKPGDLSIFKSKQEKCLTLFCSDRFKSAIESFELDGISFDENLIERFE